MYQSTYTGVVFGDKSEVSSRTSGFPCKFIDCDFSGLNLIDIDLTACYFDACKFRKTILGKMSRCYFYSCDLRLANAGNADLRWAKAQNCKSDGMILTGAQIILNCHFLSGLSSARSSDGWIYLNWAALPQTPIQHTLRDLIPEEVKLILKQEFDRDPQ